MELHQAALQDEFRGSLRRRIPVDLQKSDKELFESMPLGDVWVESRCHEAFEYLYHSKHLRRGVQSAGTPLLLV